MTILKQLFLLISLLLSTAALPGRRVRETTDRRD